uniref:Putative secreted protein n=1 Tax=Anopheles darlingi TaxID=43151 RepID=A0A2M4DHJ0_ANODA
MWLVMPLMISLLRAHTINITSGTGTRYHGPTRGDRPRAETFLRCQDQTFPVRSMLRRSMLWFFRYE